MEYLTLTNSTEIIRIASEDIVFIKGDGNYSDIYLSNGKAENVTYQLHGLMDKLEKFTYCPSIELARASSSTKTISSK